MKIDISKHEVVQRPNLAISNRYTQSGLSFQFISDKSLRLGSFVKVYSDAFKITNIEMAYEDCEYGDALLYTCVVSGRASKDALNLRAFNKSAIEIVTDEQEEMRIRKYSTRC